LEVLLQILGGGFYLLNKIFLSFSERSRLAFQEPQARRWRISSWVVYLLGLPPWVILFIYKHNWIAASVEAAGFPAMVLGLVTSFRGQTKGAPRWLNRLALVCIVAGFTYSLYDFGGLTVFNQYLEILLVAGYLIGTYLLAKERPTGYLWYIMMHVACGWLVLIEGYPWLAGQQGVSLVFIGYAYWVTRMQRK